MQPQYLTPRPQPPPTTPDQPFYPSTINPSNPQPLDPHHGHGTAARDVDQVVGEPPRELPESHLVALLREHGARGGIPKLGQQDLDDTARNALANRDLRRRRCLPQRVQQVVRQHLQRSGVRCNRHTHADSAAACAHAAGGTEAAARRWRSVSGAEGLASAGSRRRGARRPRGPTRPRSRAATAPLAHPGTARAATAACPVRGGAPAQGARCAPGHAASAPSELVVSCVGSARAERARCGGKQAREGGGAALLRQC